MSSRDTLPGPSERRPGGLLRVPFVHRCRVEWDDGPGLDALIVNINVLGAYVAHDDPPRLGRSLRLCFGLPGRADELGLRGAVAWVNQRQEHPVHSLPLGFGVRFSELDATAHARIAAIVDDYVRRQRGR